MNKIVRFRRFQEIVEGKGGVFVSYEAIAIARAVLVNEIDADELFAAIALVINEGEEGAVN